MRKSLAAAAKRISKSHKRRLIWQRFVRGMAMLVVFCTTYALILPAITMHTDPICGMESHVHSEGCYETKPVLAQVCDHSEQDEHEDSCWSETGETTTELICTLPEHTHSDSCYPVETEETLGIEYICGYAEHIHGENCTDGEGNLTCSIVEHLHEAECVQDDVDLTADLESAEDWEAMAAGVNMTGIWAQDVLAMAESQIGYAESERNFVLSGDQRFGYTRYGDWYGNPYQKWDALFVIFCLRYAGVPETAVPGESDTQQWFALLQQKDLLRSAEEQLPKPGDVVFCRNGSADLFAAVVQSATAENSNLDALAFRVIAGDRNNRVETATVAMDHIAGVCVMDLVQGIREDTPETQEPETEPTEAETEPTEAETEPTEPETEPTEAETEPTEPETEPTETATEPAETEPTEPESGSAETTVYRAETENYIVTVSCAPELALPEGAQLQVMEYSKDSQVYLDRCQEAGYELDWLLNIGFFLDDEELILNGNFDVVVTSKHGDALGQDITHFADSGTQRIDGQEDEASVSFTADGFSDFGGGVAARAVVAEKYNFVTVDPTSQLQEGVDYVIYCEFSRRTGFFSYERTLNFLTSNSHPNVGGDLHNPLQLANDVQGTRPYNIGQSWTLTASQMGTTNSDLFTWRVVKRNGNTYLVNNHSKQELYFYNGWFHLVNSGSSEATPIRFNDSGNGAKVVSSSDGALGLRFEYHDSEGYKWRGIYNNSNNDTTVYFASVNAQGRQFPHAVHTGTVEIDRLRFYNLCENGNQGVGPLAGCVFEITGANGYKATVVSGNDPELHLPSDIPNGEYTITEVSAPDGYVRDTRPSRTFVVEDGALVSDRTIGTFLNHNMEQLETSKTAEVEDYVNRIYQIDMAAKSNMRHFEVDPIDLLFVVDQSNSMLFPSGLNSTGKTVRLRRDGQNNAANMDALNLDKSQVYYIIADPNGTSTVWAVWHDGSAWMCQDASYYAKAKHANEPGYQDDNETVIFPEDRSFSDQKSAEGEGVRSNGAGLGRDLTGSSLGTHLEKTGNVDTFTVYTATNEFNRLHYLEEALVNLIYQMADVNDKNRVTLTRFTRVVNTNDCFGPEELNPDNVEALAEKVQNIKTSGGTRQDIALQHVYEEHLSDTGEHYSDADHTYTLLITDGAPVYNSGTGPTSLGGPNDAANTDGSTVYSRIKGWAAEVRKKSTLMTVGLGMESVEAGKQVLREIASNQEYYCALDDASELLAFIQQLLFDSFTAKGYIDYYGDITDEISNSFYPIAWVDRGDGNATGNRVLTSDAARDWVLLEENDWITLDGKLTAAGASDAKGQLLRRDDGTFYVKWTNQYVSGSGWDGTFYVKAKEDFIGGNAIDTNKEASVTVDGSTEYLDTPTVNVRLLPLNEMNSEVTVYLGDQVNGEGNTPLDSLKYFYENTKFTKLISDGGDILNKITVDSAKGLEEAAFYLRYAMGADLTATQWERLATGDTVTVPYVYDFDSSHGEVGYFYIWLEKTGHGSNYNRHEALDDCQPGGDPLTENCDNPVETYTLHVTYTAHKLGQGGRPNTNVHNGAAGPGREVGTGTTVENGLGILAMENIHEVHVISGEIEIIKKFADGVTDENDRTFSFTLHRVEDGPDTSRDVTQTITVPAAASAGSASIVFDGLRRGTYTVTEAVDEDYVLESITVLGSTNSYTEPPIGGTATTLVAVMGNNVGNENVIGPKASTDRYTSYIDPVNGVYAAAEFTNGPIVYPAELPVEKIWKDADVDHSMDAVYVVLYLNDAPVLDKNNNARILRLDAASGWKGTFTVYLADETDSLDNYNYAIREVSQIRTDSVPGWNSAILENDGKTLLYYEEALESGRLFAVNGKSYVVEYGVGENGQLTATNYWGTILPETGGMGSHMYTISGLLLILAAALIYGYSQRRKKERRASC